ncbi:hypothetical protein G9463_11080 [Haloarcula sp. JP-Z28]|uniref:hypothetical protein n=1 Tax=Haloarcula sp. JP-Z28 TaxID=2716715 RepID=UPI001404E3AE|nr:hypothetical protein [Haloarcula sp. JP-Z28]NHN63837.1 hypothetical protein [Haloarcula sp. JP-Z28]
MAVQDQYLKDMAAEAEFTYDELSQTADKLEMVIQSRLHKHFKNSRLRSGYDHWLGEGMEGVWLAFNEAELANEFREAGYDYDAGKLRAVAFAHLKEFQDDEITLAVPGTLARSYEDSFFYPINIRYPEGWKDGEWHTFQRFQELVSRYDMSPAEALDYWVTERRNKEPFEWAGYRDVDPEAVRKNVRQAKEKLDDDQKGATHKNGDIHIVPCDEVPAGNPHDPEKDMFYVPTEAQAEDMSS